MSGKKESGYAAVVKSMAFQDHIKKGDEFWVTYHDGWYSSHHIKGDPESARLDVALWDTPEEARAFAVDWDGAPYWCKPVSFRVVYVELAMKAVPSHYDVAEIGEMEKSRASELDAT